MNDQVSSIVNYNGGFIPVATVYLPGGRRVWHMVTTKPASRGPDCRYLAVWLSLWMCRKQTLGIYVVWVLG